jgi:predicted nucleic acid-binding protein
MPRIAKVPPVQRVLLDAEGLSALAATDRRMLAWAVAAERADAELHASTVTLAEVADGTPRDTELRFAMRAVVAHQVTADIGFDAGRRRKVASRRRGKPRDLTVDAVVAATAASLGAGVVVLTSDPEDLSRLLADTSVRVESI